ncbi:MAG TPA: YtxH domain-containing protein [Gemmatimonadaceae bacterium]|jgi:hypothetical protein|nr:YtxH domain-containing protein [Gemmatimonadaceae bacterium]
MFNAASPDPPGTSYSKAPLPGSIRQPTADEFRGEMVPDWNNIGLFTAGIAVGAILGAATALLFAPASGGEFRDRISRRVRRGSDEDVWDALAAELERAADDAEEDEDAARETVVAVKT